MFCIQEPFSASGELGITASIPVQSYAAGQRIDLFINITKLRLRFNSKFVIEMLQVRTYKTPANSLGECELKRNCDVIFEKIIYGPKINSRKRRY